jgi:sarcosine oxidase subunit beta
MRQAGLERVTLLESRRLGLGASSRAAGMVRAQGGTPAAVILGMWSREFYERQSKELGVDSGFVRQGYFMPAFTEGEVRLAHQRLAMQQSLGLEVRWLNPDEASELNPTMAKDCTLGGTYAPGDGYIDPPRNVLAYAVALSRMGVDVKEGVSFRGLDVRRDGVKSVTTSEGTIATDRVVLTGGPELGEVGRLAGIPIAAAGVRHQVAVTEPSTGRIPVDTPMVFDIEEGLYWRAEERGLLFGMSNPAELAGTNRAIDRVYLDRMRSRLAELVPLTAVLELRRVWAATIDFTPDHLPILGPAIGPDGPLAGVTVASAGGHGMMWGPAVAKAAADICLHGRTSVVDVSDLGLDRFDRLGRSRLTPDPIALPFPREVPLHERIPAR